MLVVSLAVDSRNPIKPLEPQRTNSLFFLLAIDGGDLEEDGVVAPIVVLQRNEDGGFLTN